MVRETRDTDLLEQHVRLPLHLADLLHGHAVPLVDPREAQPVACQEQRPLPLHASTKRTARISFWFASQRRREEERSLDVWQSITISRAAYRNDAVFQAFAEAPYGSVHGHQLVRGHHRMARVLKRTAYVIIIT